MEPQQRFATLVDEFCARPGVSGPDPTRLAGFGSAALKVNGSIFAMLSNGRLVVKLPAERVEELIASGTCGAYDAGKARPLREWATVLVPTGDWSELAGEAYDFVASK